MVERDFEANPYSPEEQRASDYIQHITNGQVGSGDDPIGFLIASHNFMIRAKKTEESPVNWFDQSFDLQDVQSAAVLEKALEEVDMIQPVKDAILRAIQIIRRYDVMADTWRYLWKWVERGLFDKHISENEALNAMAHYPSAPWKNGRWDVDHKGYASRFYEKFPKANGS